MTDVETLEHETLELGEGSEPMYAINPFLSDEIWVGDPSKDHIPVFDAVDLSQIAKAPTGEDDASDRRAYARPSRPPN